VLSRISVTLKHQHIIAAVAARYQQQAARFKQAKT